MAWFSSIVGSATSGDILVDSGPVISNGGRAFRVSLNGDGATAARLEWRNSDNTGTVQAQVISVPADTYVEMMGPPFGAEAEFRPGDRLRLVCCRNTNTRVSSSIYINTA